MDYTAARREAIVSTVGAYEPSEEEKAGARRLVTRHAKGPADEGHLLDVLGLAVNDDSDGAPVSYAPTAKTCRTCQVKKDPGEFNRKPGSADGRDGQCRECSRAAKRRAYAAKRDAAPAAADRARKEAARRRREAAASYLHGQGLTAREIRSALDDMEGVTR